MADSFAEFVSTRSARLLRVAYLLTRDWALAEDLLQTSLAKTWTAWRRIEGDPEPYVRRILVNTYTTWWRRRWTNEHPTRELPEHGGTDRHREVDDRDQILRALGRLPRQQRAVIVLRYYEDMSEAEIADTLGIASGTVKSHAAKGLATLRLDASLAVLRLDGEEPVGTARLAAVTRRVQQSRRQKVTAVVAACAVVLAAILGYAIRPAHRSAPHPATTPSPELVIGFPRFQMGTRLAASTTLSAAHPDGRLEWEAITTDVKFFVRCTSSTPGILVYVSFSVGTSPLGFMGCSGTPDGSGGATGAAWVLDETEKAALLAGTPVSVKIDRAELADSLAPASVPADFLVDAAVGQAVPFDLYPFPSRPSVLPELFANAFDRDPDAVHIDSDPANPLAPKSVTLAWGGWRLHSTLDAPGWITLSINGTPFGKCEKWDYATGGCGDEIGPDDQRLKDLHLRPGDRVTLTVTPQRAQHAWQVWLAPA